MRRGNLYRGKVEVYHHWKDPDLYVVHFEDTTIWYFVKDESYGWMNRRIPYPLSDITRALPLSPVLDDAGFRMRTGTPLTVDL